MTLPNEIHTLNEGMQIIRESIHDLFSGITTFLERHPELSQEFVELCFNKEIMK
jgi:hypothetical protein